MAEAHRLLETGETEGATVLLPGRGTFGSARKAIARLPGGRYASSRRSRMDNDHSTRGFARLPRGVRAAARNLGWLLASRGVLAVLRSEEHTSELQSLMRISYAVFCLKKKKKKTKNDRTRYVREVKKYITQKTNKP